MPKRRNIIFQCILAGAYIVSNSVFAMKFEPGVGIGVEFTDNARLVSDEAATDPVSDSVAAGFVGARLSEDDGDIQYDVTTSLAKHVYLDDSFSDQQYFNLGGNANWELVRDEVSLFMSDRFSQRPIQELTTNIPDNLQDSNLFTFGANFNRSISSVQKIGLVPDYKQYYYENQPTNNRQLSIAASWKYQIFRLTSVGLNLSQRNVDYTETDASGQPIPGSDFTTASVLLDTKFRRSNLMFNLGVTSVKRDEGTNNSGLSGSGFSGSATWQAALTKTSNLVTRFSSDLTDTSTVAFSADSPENSSVDNLEVTTDVVRNSLFHLTYIRNDVSLRSRYWLESRKVRYSGDLLTRETQAVGLDFSRAITRLLSGKTYLKYNRTRQLETLRKDKLYTIGANLKYRLARKLFAVFDVKYRKKDSNAFGEGFAESSFFARIVYGFGDVARPTEAGGY